MCIFVGLEDVMNGAFPEPQLPSEPLISGDPLHTMSHDALLEGLQTTNEHHMNYVGLREADDSLFADEDLQPGPDIGGDRLCVVSHNLWRGPQVYF